MWFYITLHTFIALKVFKPKHKIQYPPSCFLWVL